MTDEQGVPSEVKQVHGCGSVTCCHSCSRGREPENEGSGWYVVLGALFFLVVATGLVRRIVTMVSAASG